MYNYEKGGGQAYEARYWNPEAANICIMALVTPGVDWAAYIGAAHGVHREEEAMEWTLEKGAKLLEKDARYFFPQFKDKPYRH